MANGRLRTATFGPGFVGVIVIFCAFAAVAWILFRFAAPSETYEDKRATARTDKVAAINKEAIDKLYSGPKWIDKSKGTVQLPINAAMDLVVADYQAKAVAPSAVKVDDPYPYGLQAPAATSGSAAPATTGSAAPATSGSAATAATGTAAMTGTTK